MLANRHDFTVFMQKQHERKSHASLRLLTTSSFDHTLNRQSMAMWDFTASKFQFRKSKQIYITGTE